jgi:sec-independent protein translocase protein TatA
MFGSIGPLEIGIIALVVILLFGVGKLSRLGGDLGSSIKEFRKAVKDEDGEKAKADAAAAAAAVAPPAPQQYVAPPAPPQQPQYAQPQTQPPAQQPVAPQGDNKNIF